MSSTNEKHLIPMVKDGETFKVGGMEFIKFPSKDGRTPVVMKDMAFFSSFGSNNNLKKSKIIKRLEKEILPKIVAEIGEENVCTFETDLTTLDGLKDYEKMESKISLPTLDFYRANVDIFDKHKASRWWWLATPDSAPSHGNPYWVLCVSPSGGVNIGSINVNDYGVRPFLIFNSSIFESSENGRE